MPRNSLPVAPPPAAIAGARLELLSPTNGAAVISPFRVRARLRGMRLAPSGTVDPGAGHVHVLVDTELPILAAPITLDAHHLDFGSGEAEGEIELPAGRHRLQLLLGDGNHVPHSPPIASEPIEVVVARGPANGSAEGKP